MTILKYLNKLINKCHHHEPYAVRSLPTSSPSSSSSASSRSSSPIHLAAVDEPGPNKPQHKKTIGSANLITATATIINKQRVSSVIESYSYQHHKQNHLVVTSGLKSSQPQTVTVHHQRSCSSSSSSTASSSSVAKRNKSNRLTPIAESSAYVTDYSSMVDVDYSLCNSCEKNYDLICKRFCKCCGKDLFKKKKRRKQRRHRLTIDHQQLQLQPPSILPQHHRKSMFYSTEQSTNNTTAASFVKKKLTFATSHGPLFDSAARFNVKKSYSKLKCNIFGNETNYESSASQGVVAMLNYKSVYSAATQSGAANQHLRKSKAVSNMKQIEYNSFLTNKKKYSRAVSSTIQEENELTLQESGYNELVEVSKNRQLTKDSSVVVRCGESARTMVKSNLRRRINQKTTKPSSTPLTIKQAVTDDNNNTIGYENNGVVAVRTAAAGSTFLVDFASTPIKLAPKTSTPKRT